MSGNLSSPGKIVVGLRCRAAASSGNLPLEENVWSYSVNAKNGVRTLSQRFRAGNRLPVARSGHLAAHQRRKVQDDDDDGPANSNGTGIGQDGHE
jgi:hypothetical protein